MVPSRWKRNIKTFEKVILVIKANLVKKNLHKHTVLIIFFNQFNLFVVFFKYKVIKLLNTCSIFCIT